MKKFIVYLMVIVLTVSLGFAVYYLVDDREVISISTASIYTDVGKEFSIDVKYDNKKSYTYIKVSSSDENIVSIKEDEREDTYTFTAESGGVARLVFTTNNENFRNLYCDVVVGDGTSESPYYIGSVEQLVSIGAGELDSTTGLYKGGASFPMYDSGCCYKLINNIDVTGYNNHFWLPLRKFSGIFDGAGYTITGINIDEAGYTQYIAEAGITADVPTIFGDGVGMFSSIAPESKVYNIKFENYEAVGAYDYFGTVAGKNYGSVMRIEVKDAALRITKDTTATESFIGGIVGINETTEDSSKVRHFARVDRCSINMTAGINYDTPDGTADYSKGMSGIIGGLVGYNKGGTVIYSYSTGKMNFATSGAIYGGIIGRNEFVTFTSNSATLDDGTGSTTTITYSSLYNGANVKDCYTSLVTSMQANDTNLYAGLIAEVIDHKLDATTHEVANKIMGLYYDTDRLNSEQVGVNKDIKVGVLKYTLDNQEKPFANAELVVTGNTSSNMKVKDNYISSKKNTVVYNEEGDYSEVQVVSITWLFGSVWNINENVNDGYPTLNYNLLSLSEDFDASVISRYESVYSNTSKENYEIGFKGYDKDSIITLTVGEEETLVVNPKNVNVTWASANSAVATVVDGKITAIADGRTVITATTDQGEVAKIEVIVSAIKYVITVNTDILVAYNGTTTIAPTVTPEKAGCEFWYVVADDTVASIGNDGVITGKKVGDTTITVFYGEKATDNKYASATCNVKVTCDSYTIQLSSNALTLDINATNTATITAVVTPNGTVENWFSLDTNIVTIVGNGNSATVTAVATGSTIITAKLGNTTVSCDVTVVNSVVAVTYTVAISPSTLSMETGDAPYTLSSIITASDGSDTSNLKLSWSSDNVGVIIVDNDGRVVPMGAGTANIKATLVNDNTVFDTITITVTEKVTDIPPAIQTLDINLNATGITLYVGGSGSNTYSLQALTTPVVSGITFSWVSNNTSVATVSSSGLVTAVGKGNATIVATVTTTGYQGTAICYVTVEEVIQVPTSSISLNKTNVSMFTKATATITAITDNCTVAQVNSNNTSVVDVAFSGNTITLTAGNTSGTATITVTSSDGKTTTCNVVVSTFSINLNASSASIVVGNTKTITATTNPSGYTVTWKNDNSAVASMAISGNTITVKGLKAGTAKMTATCNGVSKTVTVTVQAVTYSISLASTKSIDLGDNFSLTATVTSNAGTVSDSVVLWAKDNNNLSWTTGSDNFTKNISADAVGTTVITVTIQGTTYSATCTVTINDVWSKEIRTLAQLKAISRYMDEDYTLCADIDVGTNWTPIGTKSNPFTGSLTGKLNSNTGKYYTINNLTTIDTEYSGLFGYTKNATIKNINISSSSITGTYAGGIVGYAKDTSLYNIIVKNVSVTATKYAGGVAGYGNGGSIYDITVTATSSKEIKLNSSIKNGAVGGIVGDTSGTIGKSGYVTEVTGSVVLNGSASSKSINVGGIAGHCSGTITWAQVDNSEIKVSSSAYGNVGGIVGYNTGLVNNSYVSGTSISGSTSNASSYVGGIVGFDGTSNKEEIKRCGITGASVTGYYVGGIVGSLSVNQSITIKWKSSTYKNGFHKSRYLESSSYNINVIECGVEDDVTISGIYAGGLAGIMTNGVISNSYTMAEVKGVSGGQVKAGFAARIQSTNMYNLGGTGNAGIVIHCYTACSFGSSNGKSYYTTESGAHLYSKTDTMRNAGYVIDYLFDKDAGDAKNPEFTNIYMNNDSAKSSADLRNSTTYTSFGFTSTYWSFGGSYATLKNLDYPF